LVRSSVKILAIALVTVASVLAQGISTKITLVDTQGAAIGNAYVLFRTDALSRDLREAFRTELRTDKYGKASTQLPSGFYDLFVGAEGFAPYCRKLRLVEGKSQDLKIVMDIDEMMVREYGDSFGPQPIIDPQASDLRGASIPFVGYPPLVYMQSFEACSFQKSCKKTDEFQVNPVPEGCCILLATNGDGRGNNEVDSYEVFLNGKRVIPAGHDRNRNVTVTVRNGNSVEVVLRGRPGSKLFLQLAFDPRHP